MWCGGARERWIWPNCQLARQDQTLHIALFFFPLIADPTCPSSLNLKYQEALKTKIKILKCLTLCRVSVFPWTGDSDWIDRAWYDPFLAIGHGANKIGENDNSPSFVITIVSPGPWVTTLKSRCVEVLMLWESTPSWFWCIPLLLSATSEWKYVAKQ